MVYYNRQHNWRDNQVWTQVQLVVNVETDDMKKQTHSVDILTILGGVSEENTPDIKIYLACLYGLLGQQMNLEKITVSSQM